MLQGKTLLRALLVLFTISLISVATMVFPGCDNPTTMVEVIGQKLELESEGKYNAVRLGLYYETKFTGHALRKLGTPFSAAYANTPKPPVFANKLTSLHITGNTDFNNDFKAGADWASMFNVLGAGESNFVKYPLDLTPSGGRLRLTLTKAPSAVIQISFIITSTFDNGTTVTSSSETLTVMP